jgi:Domain of unknown function (DUF932)
MKVDTIRSYHAICIDTTKMAACVCSTPEPTLSTRYSHVHTQDLVDCMARNGWEPVEYTAKRRGANSLKRDDTVKHAITFRPVGEGSTCVAPELGQLQPRVVLVNSHDGSSGWSFHFGFLRLVCLNGLMVGDVFGGMKGRHINTSMSDLEAKLAAVAAISEEILTVFKAMAAREMTEAEKKQFAIEALSIRYGDKAVTALIETGKLDEVVANFLTERRAADGGESLWVLFNRLQETSVAGLQTRRRGQLRTAVRSVRSGLRALEMTEKLFAAAKEYLQAA